MATLPTTFVTSTGEVRTVRLAAGILTRKAVVLDLEDGSRRVVGLWCHLPYGGGRSGFQAAEASCGIAPLNEWRDGNAPPSIPPGVEIG